MKMNRIASTISFGLALGLLTDVSLSAAQTQTVTTSKTTTYSGVVSELNPSTSTIILKSEASPAPVTYTYTKETSFVDVNGNVVSSETIRNSPVRIEYSTEGGVTIVRKVIQMQPSVVVTPPSVIVTPPAVLHEKTTTHTETESR